MKRIKIKIAFLLLFLILLSGFGLKCTTPAEKAKTQPIELNYWRVWDGPDAFEEIIANYRKTHPYVDIKYKKLSYSEYEKELLDALAEDRGPDIFSLHNTWLKKYESKIAPLPGSLTVAEQTIKGTIKKDEITEVVAKKSLTAKEVQNNFVDAVYTDVVSLAKDEKSGEIKQQILGLPLGLDVLALYYNKDLLNNAGIAQPPQYWNREFQESVEKLTKEDSQGQITQSAVALGGSKNIERASDLLSILMMQNGAVMMEQDKVTFNQTVRSASGGGKESGSPAVGALNFYKDFADPGKTVYSWNSSLDNSLEMFIQGRLALMFGYAYHLPLIKSRAPKLNFSIAKFPQLEGNSEVNFANYWVETVSKKSKNIDIAWDFVQFAAQAEQARSYLNKSGKPTALRSLIDEQRKGSEDLKIFVDEILTARSWYHGRDPLAAENVMLEIIDMALAGQNEPAEIINFGAQKIQQTVE